MRILPIFIPSRGCPYKCVYCDQAAITNTTEIDLQDITRRIKEFCQFDPIQSKEIAFFGGTFTNLSEKSIDQLLSITDQHISNTVTIRISTRPDHINLQQLFSLRERGLRTVELGIQSFNDEVLSRSGRSYTSETALKACEIVQSADLKLGIQLMPGLPGFTQQSLIQTVQTAISVNPDFVRIYPTVVLKGTVLEKLFLKGNYQPLTLDEAIRISAIMITEFQENNIKIIKTGLHSDINPQNIVAGPYHNSFGELVRMELMFKKIIANYQEQLTFVISEYDISLFKGFKQKLIEKIKLRLKIDTIPLIIDPQMKKGELSFTCEKPLLYW